MLLLLFVGACVFVSDKMSTNILDENNYAQDLQADNQEEQDGQEANQEVNKRPEMRPGWNFWYDRQYDLETNTLDKEALLREQREVRNFTAQSANKTSTLSQDIEWEELGPDNIGGRSRTLLIDKDNDQVLYAGGVTGGLFKSTNAGATWIALRASTDIGCTNISTLLQTADGTIYIGTGNDSEGSGESSPHTGGAFFPGSGIYKTTDGGETITLLESTSPASNTLNDGWLTVNKLAARELDGTTLIYAATYGGLQISDNGGTSWQIAEGKTKAHSLPVVNGEVDFGGAILHINTDGTNPVETPSGILIESPYIIVQNGGTVDSDYTVKNTLTIASNPVNITSTTLSTGGETFEINRSYAGSKPVYDISVSSDGSVYAANGKAILKASDGINFERIDAKDNAILDIKDITGSSTDDTDDGIYDLGKYKTNNFRQVIATAPSNPDYVYIVEVYTSGCLYAVAQSKDAGLTFTTIGERTDSFDPMALWLIDGCQGWYDLCLGVDPNNEGAIYVGGVSLWKWVENGGWNQVDYYCGFTNSDPACIHPDKHGLFFHPTNSDILYNTNDGGVTVTYNATDTYPAWQPKNKGLNILQCYGIGTGMDGVVMSGAQDNGTNYIGYEFNSLQSSIEVRGGDGGHTAISKIKPDYLFASAQVTGNSGFVMGRSIAQGGFLCLLTLTPTGDPNYDIYGLRNVDYAGECMLTGGSPFITPYHMWEDYDLYYKIQNHDFSDNPIYGKDREGNDVLDANGNKVVVGFEEETINYNGQTFIVTSNVDLYDPVPENIYTADTIYIAYNIGLSSNVTIGIEVDESTELKDSVYVTYDLEDFSLLDEPNDDRYKRNKMVVGGSNGRIFMTHDALKPGISAQWINLTSKRVLGTDADFVANGTLSAYSFSQDGDVLATVTNTGRVHKLTNLNAASQYFYVADSAAMDTLRLEHPIASRQTVAPGQFVTGVSIDPNDKNHVVISAGTYGNTDYVYETNNFMDEEPVWNSIQGNLPVGPVLSCVVLRGDDTYAGDVRGNVLVGTANGMYYGSKDSSGEFTWEYQSEGIGQVPCLILREEPMRKYGEDVYTDSYVVYVATHGRGIFRTTTLNDQGVPSDVTDLPEFLPASIEQQEIRNANTIKVFPNPIQGAGNIELNLVEETKLVVNIFDLQGRLVLQKADQKMAQGRHLLPINQGELKPGTYIVSVQTSNQKLSTKLIVAR